MELHSDFRELLALFVDREVEFVVVGGYALAHHGAPRFTGDLDLYVRPTAENAERVLAALEAFGFGGLDLGVRDFVREDQVVQLGVPPVRVDLLTSLTGVTWDEVASGAEAVTLAGLDLVIIGREAFVANKRASGRAQDLADLEALGDG